MHSLDAEVAGAAVLALVLLSMTAAFHHEALRVVAGGATGERVSHLRVILFVIALVSVHLIEVALYAAAYVFGANVLHIGGLRSMSEPRALDFFYFAAQTYSTLGYGDLVPVGGLRLIASVEALNGLVLLSWSGAFLFGVLDGTARNGSPFREPHGGAG